VPNHKSAEKRDRQRIKRRLANRMLLGRMRTAISKARTAIDAGSDECESLVKLAVQFIDKAVTKGAVKRNTGSRYVSRLSRRRPPAAA
jgi:small subunit ribosomal protein S20